MLQLLLVMQHINLNISMQNFKTKFIANSMIDSGSVCSIINKTLANNILKRTPSARWIASTCEKDLTSHLNEPIKVLGKIAITVVYTDWICEDSCLKVLENGQKLIIGRYLFSSLRLTVVQQQIKRGKCVKNINNSACKVKQEIASQISESYQ